MPHDFKQEKIIFLNTHLAAEVLYLIGLGWCYLIKKLHWKILLEIKYLLDNIKQYKWILRAIESFFPL